MSTRGLDDVLAPLGLAIPDGLDAMSAVDRTGELARWAASTKPTEVARAIDALCAVEQVTSAGSPCVSQRPDPILERSALHLAEVVSSRAPALLVAFLGSSVPDVRVRAVVHLARVGATEPLLLRLPDLSAVEMRALVSAVRDPAVADLLLPAVRHSWGDRYAGSLLARCSAATVTRLLPGLWPFVSRRSIAARHPAAAMDALAADLPGRLTAATWRAASADEVLLAVLEKERATWLEPVRAFVSDRHAFAFTGTALRARWSLLDPQWAATELAGLSRRELKSWQRDATRGTLRRLASTRAVTPLARALWGTPALARLLTTIPPHRRAGIWETIRPGGRLSPQVLTEQLLRALPHEVRAREARLLIEQTRQGNDETAESRYAQFLPLSEAEPLFSALRRSADPAIRAEACTRVVLAAGDHRDPAEFARVLAALSLRNEQDPVRVQVLHAVATVPGRVLADECAPALNTLLTDAAEAHDQSFGTVAAVRAICGRILMAGHPPHSALVDVALTGLRRGAGAFHLPDLDRNLPRGAEDRIFAALRPLIDEQRGDHDYDILISLVRAFGQRTDGCAPLQELLGDILLSGELDRRGSKYAGVFRALAHAWLAVPRLRDARVRRLTEAFPAAVVHPLVWPIASTRLTDLLTTTHLTGATRGFPAGLEKSGVWLPPDVAGAARWTNAQVAALDGYLRSVATRRRRETHGIMRALALGCALPGTGTGFAISMIDHGAAPVRGAALAGLAHTDDPEKAADVLVGFLDGDHAKIAGYALLPVGRRIPRARFEQILRSRLDGEPRPKVTALKAILFTATACGLPLAFVRDTAERSGHRDVLGAAVSVAMGRLDDPVAWEILDRWAATAPLVGDLIGAIWPSSLIESHHTRFAALVATLCTVTADELTRAWPTTETLAERTVTEVRCGAFAVVPRWADIEPSLLDLVYGAICDIGEDNSAPARVVQAAMRTAHALVREGRTARWQSAIEQLVEHDRVEPVLAVDGSVRRVAWARLRQITAVSSWADHDTAVQVARPVVKYLGAVRDGRGRDVYRALAVDLAAGAVPLEPSADAGGAPAADLDGWTALVTACGCSTAHALRAAEALAGRLDGTVPHASLEQVVDRLLGPVSACPDCEVPAVLAVPLVAASGRSAGWSQTWRAALSVLRTHKNADVASAAYEVGVGE